MEPCGPEINPPPPATASWLCQGCESPVNPSSSGAVDFCEPPTGPMASASGPLPSPRCPKLPPTALPHTLATTHGHPPPLAALTTPVTPSTDGPLSLPYSQRLTRALQAMGVAVVHPVLASSYAGYGHHSLDSDVDDMKGLLAALGREYGVERVTWLGHSTGCQGAAHFFRTLASEAPRAPDLAVPHGVATVTGVILQGPVSDREYMQTLPQCPEMVALALDMVQSCRGSEMMPRRCGVDEPITAERYASLTVKGGADDYFSSDLTDEELAAGLGGLTVPTMVVMSGDDEYIPDGVDKALLARRLHSALPCGGGCHVVPGGDHALSSAEASGKFVQLVCDFVAGCSREK